MNKIVEGMLTGYTCAYNGYCEEKCAGRRVRGYSSYMYLQNVIPAGYKVHQDVALALAMCEHYLQGKGAYRVHGGGFAGTVQAFVPFELLEDFRAGIDSVLGEGACHVLRIRVQGGVEMEAEK